MAESRRSKLEKQRANMDNEKSSFLSHWRDLGDFILPRRPRWTAQDVNQGDKRNQKIIDSTATYAARTLASGMMSGVTSPARPWFRLSTHDPGMMENQRVKQWLHVVTERMRTVFLRSNYYNSLPIVYGDLGVFATGAMYVEEDFEKVIHTGVFPIGSYSIGASHKGVIDQFARTYTMSVRQLVDKFGRKKESGSVDWSNISARAKDYWDHGDYEVRFEIAHQIHPNTMFDRDLPESRYKKFASTYYEIGAPGQPIGDHMEHEQDTFLRDMGYDEFPVLVPRWEVNGEDYWGTNCPGMLTLGDIKQLQTGEKRSGQAIEKNVNPAMIGPSHMKNSSVSILPGHITYVDIRDGQNSFRPAHEVRPMVGELEQKQEQVRARIKKGFFEDLFLMLASSDRRTEMTAREVDERHEEKLWALGPVLDQINQDMLDPSIDITFDMMNKQGLVPPPPPELEGVQLKVEYTSVMAQAQKMIGLGSVERFFGFASQAAAVNPNALDKVNIDQMIDVYGDMTGVPPGIVNDDEEVAKVRAQRAQQLQEQQKLANEQMQAGTAKDMSQALSTGGDALTEAVEGQ